MFTKEVILLIQDFYNNFPEMSEETQDFVFSLTYALLDTKKENKLPLWLIKYIAMTQVERGTNYLGETMVSSEEKMALKGLVYKLVYLKEEKQ